MNTEVGTISISNEVIAVIAKIATEEIHGVVSLTGSLSDVIKDSLKNKDLKTAGIKVETGSVEAALDIRIVVEYGRNLRQVAREVQENVARNVELMTGLTVVEVNVVVENIQLPKEVEVNDDKKQKLT